MNRRKFLIGSSCSFGAVAFTGTIMPFTVHAGAGKKVTSGKKLIATTDYYDNILTARFLFDRSHLDSLHKYLSSIGVTRHQWIVDTIWNFYDQPCQFDLLAEAAESAHRFGLEFYALIKPFEGGGFGNSYPLSLPFSKAMCALKDIRGIYPVARPFVAANPHLCLKRRPGSYEFSAPVSAIRLVKADSSPTRIKPEYIEIRTSSSNNGFERYNGPVSFRETVEWRQTFPKSRECRVLHLEGLKLPDGHNYILVLCSSAGKDGDFSNERGNIIELADSIGNPVPFIISTGKTGYSAHRTEYDSNLYDSIVRYFGIPDVREEFVNREKAEKHYRDFYCFDERIRITEPYVLDRTGYIVVACGKPEYMPGNLHPIYPEVRKHWLGMISFCLDRGVDGISIRHSNHVRSPEDWEYGFNDPVIDEAGGTTDYPAIRHVNGNAYTRFLREARDLVKDHGKTIAIHLYSQMLMPDDRIGQSNYLPPNFEWQWKTWIREIADELEFRGAWTLHPWNLRQVLETFGSETKAANKPFFFQGNMKELGFKGPFHYEFTEGELDMVKNEQKYDGFVLYETANFTRMKEDAAIEGSPELEKILKKYLK